jgi:hypothetical protein
MRTQTKRCQHELRTVAETLDYVARLLRSEGLEQPAKSVETTIADLGWQCEQLERVGGTAPDLRLVSG